MKKSAYSGKRYPTKSSPSWSGVSQRPEPLIYASGEGYYLRHTTEGELGSGAGFAIIRG